MDLEKTCTNKCRIRFGYGIGPVGVVVQYRVILPIPIRSLMAYLLSETIAAVRLNIQKPTTIPTIETCSAQAIASQIALNHQPKSTK
jgi:hypothetical protein